MTTSEWGEGRTRTNFMKSSLWWTSEICGLPDLNDTEAMRKVPVLLMKTWEKRGYCLPNWNNSVYLINELEFWKHCRGGCWHYLNEREMLWIISTRNFVSDRMRRSQFLDSLWFPRTRQAQPSYHVKFVIFLILDVRLFVWTRLILFWTLNTDLPSIPAASKKYIAQPVIVLQYSNVF